MKKIVLTMAMCASVMFASAQLIKNDFLAGYSSGQSLEKGAYAGTDQPTTEIKVNQWNLSGKTGANDQSTDSSSPEVVASLTYDGYVDSDKDVAIDLLKLPTGGRTSVYSMANDDTYGAGTYYLAFMFNVTVASPTTGHEFLALDGNFTGNAQRARFGVKGIAETENYQIGISGSASAPSTFSGEFAYGTTYLAVMKVVLVGDGTGTATLYLNPSLTGAESAATAFATVAIEGTALKSIRGLALRQRSTLAAQLGGFRLASSWELALGQGSTGVKQTPVDKGNIVATSYYTLTGVEVQEPANGVYIQKATFENGAVETTKIIK